MTVPFTVRLAREGIDINLVNVHPMDNCAGRECVIHNPSDHHMRHMRLHWRDDRGIFERICEHGTGHPDPDQFKFWDSIGQSYQSVHGCDGCCAPPLKETHV